MAKKALGDDLIPNLKSKIKDLIKTEMLNQSYPVGSIYMSTTLSTAAQVNAALGGTWQAWGSGRVVMSSTSPESTGGSETHSHTQGDTGSGSGTIGAASGNTGASSGNTGSHTLTSSEIPSHTHSGIYWNTARVSLNGGSGGYSLSWNSGSANDTTYFTVGNTGGGGGHTHSLNSHTHSLNSHTHSIGSHTHTNPSTNSASNMPPYITCYMYKRTS